MFADSAHSLKANQDNTGRKDALDLMRALPGFIGIHFNPQLLIKVFNYFYKIGLDQSLQVLRDYCSLAQQTASEYNPENVFLIARILFVLKDEKKELPQLVLGQPDFEEPDNRTLFPLFPLHIYQDIPLLLIGGYLVGGQGQPPLDHLKWCEQYCQIRSKTLTPNDNPLGCVDRFLRSDAWLSLNPEEWHYSMLRLQALHAVSNIYPISQKDERDILSSTDAERNWYKHRQKFELLNVSWNIRKDEYKIVSE